MKSGAIRARCRIPIPGFRLGLHPGYDKGGDQTGGDVGMALYRRNVVPGGSFFFTVTLRDRRSHLLVDYIDCLRTVYAEVHRRRPFRTEAMATIGDRPRFFYTELVFSLFVLPCPVALASPFLGSICTSSSERSPM